MSAEQLVILALCLPTVGIVLIGLAGRWPDIREAVTLVTAVVLFGVVLSLLSDVLGGARPEVSLLEIVPGIALKFAVEPLGMLFATIASGLWIVNSIYSIGYMRGNDEPRQTPFYMCFAAAIASTLGIAFAANLFTLFIFYEVLTLSTYPLVTHKGTEEAKRAGGSIFSCCWHVHVAAVAAIMWTWVTAGTLTLPPGGILAGKVDGLTWAFFWRCSCSASARLRSCRFIAGCLPPWSPRHR